MSARGWLCRGTMVEELELARREVPLLRARVAELEAELAERLPWQHYLSQLRTVAAVAAADEDHVMAQLGDVLDEALDVVEVHQRLIEDRIAAAEMRAAGAARVRSALHLVVGGQG